MSNEILKKNFLDTAVFFIKHNIKKIIVLSIITFVFFLVFLFYKNLNIKNDIKISEQYTQATIYIKQNKINESKMLLESIINTEHKFYSPLALYLIVENNIEYDKLTIITFFDKIIKNKSIDKENLNLIKIKKAIYLIDLDKEDMVIETLNPIINSNSVWKKIAINLITEYFLSKGQKNKAKEYSILLKKESKK
jgi:predicted negative regulator of RcsB-dependent stress response|tara:strand:- start:7359 stop:7940 length:582 start_codon:yes stop_codon:yes gene_type:complete